MYKAQIMQKSVAKSAKGNILASCKIPECVDFYWICSSTISRTTI